MLKKKNTAACIFFNCRDRSPAHARLVMLEAVRRIGYTTDWAAIQTDLKSCDIFIVYIFLPLNAFSSTKGTVKLFCSLRSLRRRLHTKMPIATIARQTTQTEAMMAIKFC